MVILEIMNSFIINLEFQFIVPQNKLFDSLTFEMILPPGLTYALKPGARVKEVTMLGWIANAFIDNSTQASISKDFKPSAISLCFNAPIFNPLSESTFMLSIPVLVYDAPLLTTGKQTYLLATLRPTRKDGFIQDCAKEYYAYQFKEATLHLYAEKIVAKNSTTDINLLNVAFPLLYNSSTTLEQNFEQIPTNLTYELSVTLPENTILMDSINLHTSHPQISLIKDLDYSMYFLTETSELIIMVHPHESLCGKTIYCEIPFKCHTTYPASKFPTIFLFDTTLTLVNGIRSETILIKKGIVPFEIQPDPPSINQMSVTISLV